MNEETATPQGAEASEQSSQPPHIVVIGSINMDLVVRAPSIPSPGQTVAGYNFSSMAGGKGANQAVAAARCGGQVSMIGRVGNDDFGERLLVGLKNNNVDTSAVMVTEGYSTGTAMIIVDDIGENAICVAGGANLQLSGEDIDEHMELIYRADLIVMQLEIPLGTVAHVIQEVRHRHIPVLLNPAPAPGETNPALFDVDILIPNQDETAKLCGEPAKDLHSAKLAGSALVGYGAQSVVVTLGRRGALAITKEQSFKVEPYNAKVVDTTGAGDAFCGAFAVAYARQLGLNRSAEVALKKATRFASAAGALACNKFGAQPSMPHLEDVLRLLKRSC